MTTPHLKTLHITGTYGDDDNKAFGISATHDSWTGRFDRHRYRITDDNDTDYGLVTHHKDNGPLTLARLAIERVDRMRHDPNPQATIQIGEQRPA